jgi:two-component system, OmpR family, sensor kinase
VIRRQRPTGAALVGIITRFRLQRRMFMWFGATILLTGVVVSLVMYTVAAPSRTWSREVARMGNFTRGRFEKVWDRPAERDELGAALAEQLDVDVSLRDAEGRQIAQFGEGCVRPSLKIDVARRRTHLGQVFICAERHHAISPARILLSLFIAGGMVWGASGAIARRLSRPIAELSRVAQDIGQGKLSSRVRLDRHSRGEVGILADVLNDMAARIERQMADQRALLAAVSHEIRTPLARMRILLELTRDRLGEDGSLDKLDREVIEIDQLVADLLASSRIDFSAMSRKVLDPREIALAALERAEVDPTTLSFESAAGGLRGDPTLIARAVLNLLENAKRHGGGVETLKVFDRPNRIVFEVEDAGPGLAAGDETKIFLPFYRAQKGEGDARSVGLGLSLVKRIAEAHGGTAYAENRAGGSGARVGIELSLDGEPKQLDSSLSPLEAESYCGHHGMDRG